MRTKKPILSDIPPIYTLDLETDPFAHKRIPQPFVAGLYDGKEFTYFWGFDCVKKMVKFLETLPPGIIYAHNGGRFDFYYFLRHLVGDMMIINSRIIKATLGKHQVRDSFAIMPFALKQYKKDDIDYTKLEKEVRDIHREEILRYLESDCVYLWELCDAFLKMFGDKLTIGSTSMGELQKLHKFERMSAFYDAKIREKFYFGGRVECFKKGIIEQPCKIYDVNSMYPSVMRDYEHPLAPPSSCSKKITDETCFIIAQGKNYGAFPVRDKSGIRFDIDRGIFGVTIHEWRAAIKHDLFRPDHIINCVNFDRRGNFSDFVNHFYNARKVAIAEKDETKKLFFKYVLNSAYGKFAQNPENYMDYMMSDGTGVYEGWSPTFINGDYTIWKRPSVRSGFARHNVATACSITGAARAILLEAIATCKNPVYCDTDSIICEEIGSSVKIDSVELGAWKLEKEGDTAAVAGKKLYAIFDKGKCVKLASKGAKLTPEEIDRVARGEKVVYENQAPSFKWDGSYNFITREIRLT